MRSTRPTTLAPALLAAMLRSSTLLPAVAGLAVGATFAAAHADVKGVAPYLVVAMQDNTEIKCSDGGAFYPVGRVKAGQVLRADGEGQGWIRVEYAPGMRAFVKVEEAQVDEATKSVKLIVPSKLMAANEKPAERSNWWQLLEQSLPAGSTLTLAEVLKGADGKVYGYLVNAPASARGYVREQAVRRATPDEVAAFERANGPTTPAPAATTPAPTPSAGTTPGTQPAQPTPVNPASTTPTSPVPGTDVVSTPSVHSGAPTPPPAAPAVTSAQTQPVPMPQPVEDVTLLAEKFDSVMAQGTTGAEIDAVIAEFNRKIASTSDANMKQGLNQRVEALKLKKDIIDRSAKVRSASNFDEKERKVQEAVVAAQRQSVYTIVGRILPSTVYDGKRGMPLMYRVEAADSASTRTIGYVVPMKGVNLLVKTGKVVGIVGEGRFDEALQLNIVSARRVDVLNPSGVFEQDQTPAATEPTPANEATKPAEPAGNSEDADLPDSVTVEDPGMDGK